MASGARLNTLAEAAYNKWLSQHNNREPSAHEDENRPSQRSSSTQTEISTLENISEQKTKFSMTVNNTSPTTSPCQNPASRSGAAYEHAIRKPTAQSISLEGHADKLRQIRSWSPVSLRRMKAEVSQWQAVIATVEAEKNPEDDAPQKPAFAPPKLPPISVLLSSLPDTSQFTSIPARPSSAVTGTVAMSVDREDNNKQHQPTDCSQ
ncbi:hypothetical protein F5Y04DRAFT_285477 [Hypomontagnella monticulosa]|nr:hypothetical protein F5Y04DRAFT_285477 [Hypomontagnella monticulosa]